jgi:membrane fusion protein
MPNGLFRDEMLAAHRGEWLGTIRLRAPHLGWIFFGTGMVAVAAILALLIAGHYTRRERVTGTLVPSTGLLTVIPVDPGVITRVLAREGDTVRAGQPLLEISGAQDAVALGNAQAAIAAQLRIKRTGLQADLSDQQNLARLQEQDLRARLSMLHGQIAQMDQQIALQQQRADSAMALYQQWSQAARTGVISKVQALQQHDTALQNIAQVKALKGQALQLRQQAGELQGQLAQLPPQAANKRHATERALADVVQSMAQNAVQSAVVLRSPADGTVANVLVHPGQAIAAQQPLATVLPTGATLQAELWVPSQAIGFVHTGEPVVMRYRAYPYQKFGQHMGHVSEVSRSAISPKELSQWLGQDVKEPRYRVEVTLDSQKILAYGRSEALRPGMALDADVLLDRRRLLEWVFEPLYGFTRALHPGESTQGGAR